MCIGCIIQKTNSNVYIMDQTTDCVICLDEMHEDTITFPCKHKLHNVCFSQYLMHKLQHVGQHSQTLIVCPLCQKIILTIQKLESNNEPIHNQQTNHRTQRICLTLTNLLITFGISSFIYCIFYNTHIIS